MTGYKQPPRHTQFKKGQSGNPHGRPRHSAPSNVSKLVLAVSERLVSVREGDQVSQISVIEGIIRAQQASAMKGSPLAQKYAIEMHRQAEAERRAAIEEKTELWRGIVANLRFIYAEAERNGKPTPRVFPHPDDVVIDAERGVSFIGPLDEDQLAKLENTLKVRDLLFAQDSFDRRAWSVEDFDDPERGPGGAALMAHTLDFHLPARYRLSDFQLMRLMRKFDCMSKRDLAKLLFQSWKALGHPVPRGRTFCSIGVGKQVLTVVYDVLSGKYRDAAEIGS